MRLGRLTRLERNKVMEEYEEVIKRIAYLEDLLAHEPKIMLLIKDELADLKKKYGDARRTQLDFQGSVELNEEDLVPKEDVVVTLTHRGYVKRVPATTYRPQRRGGKGILGAARVESDFVEHLAVASTHSDMLFFTNHGSVFRLRVHEIPDVNRQAKGLPIANLIDIDPKDKITAVVGITDWAEDRYLVMVTKQGTIKKTPARLYSQVRRNGLIAIDLDEGDELNWVKLSSGSDELIIATTDGKAVRFNEKQAADGPRHPRRPGDHPPERCPGRRLRHCSQSGAPAGRLGQGLWQAHAARGVSGSLARWPGRLHDGDHCPHRSPGRDAGGGQPRGGAADRHL